MVGSGGGSGSGSSVRSDGQTDRLRRSGESWGEG